MPLFISYYKSEFSHSFKALRLNDFGMQYLKIHTGSIVMFGTDLENCGLENIDINQADFLPCFSS